MLLAAPEPATRAVPSVIVRPAAKPRFYHPELDALRFFAFLGVFISHLLTFAHPDEWWQQPAAIVSQVGRYGVDLFFLLSSFLITTLLVREQAATGRIDIKAFYIRRALRIWPLYYAALLVMMGIVPKIFPGGDMSAWHPMAFSLFLGNWSVAFLGWPASAAAPLWSVSVEEQFYIIWPLLISWLGVSRIVRVAWIALAIGTASRVVAVALGASTEFMWCATPLRMEPIALGALIAVYVMRHRALDLAVHSRAIIAACGIAALAACSIKAPLWVDLIKYPAVAVACGAILLSVLTDKARITRRNPLVYLGTISYGLYVFHEFAITATFRLGVLWLCFPATVAVAALSYHLWERPFLKLKDRFAHVASRSV